MVQSMTGFASTTLNISSAEGLQTHVTINLKTLNSRYLEITCKLPAALSHLETHFIKLLKEKLYRGNIFLTMNMRNQNIFQVHVEASIPAATNYIAAIKKIQETCNLPGEVSIGDMLRLAHAIFIVEQQECDTSVEQSIIQGIENLINNLVMTRIQEGAVLQQDMEERIAIIKNTMYTIATSAANFMEYKKQEVAEKIAALEGESSEFIQMKRNSLHTELDKIDIHEEITRFNAHLESLRNLFNSKEQEKGRHSNFILQELGREINTLSAKCSDIYIGNLAITVKVELEKVREQSQNIV